MARKVLGLMVVCVVGLGFCGESRAQVFFDAGPPPMVNMGAWIDQQRAVYLDQQRRNWETSQGIAAMGRPGERIQFNMRQHQANMAGLQGAHDDFMAAQGRYGRTVSNAATGFSLANMGQWPYGNASAGVPPTVQVYSPSTYTVPLTHLGTPGGLGAVPGTVYPPLSGLQIYPEPVFRGYW